MTLTDFGHLTLYTRVSLRWLLGLEVSVLVLFLLQAMHHAYFPKTKMGCPMAQTGFHGTGTSSSQHPGAAWPHGNQGSDVGVTGQPVGPAAVASQAGLKAAEHGAQSSEQASMANGAADSHGGKSGTLPAATIKALSDALVVLLKKHSVVNQTDIRCGFAAGKQRVGCMMKGLLRLHSCRDLEVAGHEPWSV